MKTVFYVLCWLVVSLTPELAGAQTNQKTDSVAVEKRGPYTLVVMVGGGLSYYSTHLGVPPSLQQASVSRFGVPGSIRVMWYPDHRLRIGVESGWTTMYSYKGLVGGETAKTYVSAVPILLVFSMPLGWLRGTERSLFRRLSLTAGAGAYVITSRLDYAGTVISQTNSTGWMAAGSYTQPIGRRVRVAAELKWFDAVAAEDAAFAIQLHIVWRPFSW